jgi:hypothetical protein
MRGRAALFALLGSALMFLASLYLPWRAGPARSCGPGCVQSAYTVDGWWSGIGDVAALVGLGLAAVAAAALARPTWRPRLPLGRCSLGVGYVMLAVAATIRAHDGLLSSTSYGFGLHLHWAYGAWLGMASAGLAVGAATALRGRDLARRPSAPALVFALLGLGLLASLLLPWSRYRFAAPSHAVYSTPGITYSAAALAGLAVFVGAASDTRRLGTAGAVALFTGAAFSAYAPGAQRAYGAWLALSFALALLGFATVSARGALRRPAPAGALWIVAGAAAVFVASLFLRWQTFCAPAPAGSGGVGHGIGVCISANGWTIPNSTAAMLALLVAAAPVVWLRRLSSAELAVGTGFLVATAGFETQQFVRARLAYGAFVGFAAAGAFVLLTVSRHRPPPLDRGRLAVRLVPVTGSLLFVLGVLIPSWGALPSPWGREAGVLVGWLAVAGLLLSLHLLRAWLPLTGRSPSGDETLTLVPVALLALAVLGIGHEDLGVTWGDGIRVALCLLLLALGWLERRQGLENIRLPEILRLDRLPGAEG